MTTNLTVAPHSTDQLLATLLDDELDLDPVASGDFINHLAMSLVALRRLGGSDDELQQWYDAQTSGDFLVPRVRPDWLVPESDEVRSRGAHAVIAERLPSLVGSPGSQFFHAIIRLDLAVDAGHAGQVANALRNWAAHDHPLPDPPTGDGHASYRHVLARLAAATRDGAPAPTGSHELASTDWFTAAMSELAAHDGLLEEVSEAAASSHLEPRHFGTLHLVTGTRAAQALSPLLDDVARRTLALRTAQAVAVTYVSIGAPALAEPVDEPASTGSAEWASIARRAIASGDPHVAKLVYACRLEEDRTGSARYRPIASRQVS
ncbi:MAG: questin oxidase family protein [Microthrixaceae bacterium]